MLGAVGYKSQLLIQQVYTDICYMLDFVVYLVVHGDLGR